MGTKNHMQQNAAEEASLKTNEDKTKATYHPQGELVVVHDGGPDA